MNRYALLICCLLLGACASARNVKFRQGKGGIVALKPGWDGDGRKQAQGLMDANCNRGFRIVEEGESKIGSDSSRYGDVDILMGSGDVVESRDANEWRIKYACKKSKARKRKKSK